MKKLGKLSIPLFISILFAYCDSNDKNHDNVEVKGNLELTLEFRPAFHEHSEVKLTNSDQSIQFLIRSNLRADPTEDTFWYRKMYLTSEEFKRLDSTLIKVCRQKLSPTNIPLFDGMPIRSMLVLNKDTNFIFLHSPSKLSDSIGYSFVSSVFRILNETFIDTVINQYVNDIESYIDESKYRRADSTIKIDRMRMKIYGWQIRDN